MGDSSEGTTTVPHSTTLNKPYRKAEQPPKLADSAEKPDLIPQKKDAIPTQPKDVKKPDTPRTIPTPQPTEPSFFNSKTPETPRISETKPNFPSPKTPEVPKMPDFPKVPSKTPESPKVPEMSKATPKTPDAPKIPPRTPESSKVPDFRLAPEVPKKPEAPKTPESPKIPAGIPKTPDSFKPKVSESDPSKPPEGSSNMMPSRRPESVMPDFPPSNKNPSHVTPSSQSEFPIPPYLPGAPQNKPLSSGDELFAMGNTFNNPRPTGNLRDLSYAKGEFPGEEVSAKVEENLSRMPKYMEQSVISNPDSLESDEEDVDF